MHILTWREIDFASAIVSGLIAGYVMAIGGLWAGKIPGLVAVDIADFGRRYMISDRPSAWLLGLASHLINSILLVFLWASIIQPNLPLPNIISAIAWGIFLGMTLAGALVGPLSGLGFMGWKTGSHRFALTSFLLHLLWGLIIGVVYTP